MKGHLSLVSTRRRPTGHRSTSVQRHLRSGPLAGFATTTGVVPRHGVNRPGPWRGLNDVEFATLDYVDWFNHRRLHGEIGKLPLVEFEAAYYDQITPAPLAVTQ